MFGKLCCKLQLFAQWEWVELDAIVQQMYCACTADTDIAKRVGKFSKSANTMCTAPMACYRSGYLLETKDNSHRRRSFTTVTKLWCNWTGWETVNANSQARPNPSMLFLTAGDKFKRTSWTTTSKEGTSSASTLIMLDGARIPTIPWHQHKVELQTLWSSPNT